MIPEVPSAGSTPICTHTPTCPSFDAVDRDAAHVIVSHPEQGWSLLCNGLIVFEDTGTLLPDCSVVAPHRARTCCRPGEASGCRPADPQQPKHAAHAA